MYLTYADYQSYGGTLEETAFNNFEYEAETVINHLTFSRLKHDTEFPEEVSRCVFAIIDLLQKQADALSLGSTTDGPAGAITSQSNDGVSVSYNGMSASILFDKSKDEIETKVKYYLEGVKNQAGLLVLYRGLYPGE